jgi:signal transduction histidine kinase
MSAVAQEPAPLRPLGSVILDALLGAVYIGLSFVLGILYLPLFITGTSVGLGLAVIGIGIPILLATAALAWVLLHFERELAIKLLGAEIPPLVRKRTPGGGIFRSVGDFFTSPAVWKGLAFIVLKLPIAIVTFTIAVSVWGVVFLLLDWPFVDEGVISPALPAHGARAVVLRLLAIPAIIVGIGVLDGLRSVLRWLATVLLSSPPPPGTIVRDSLAEGLRDATLTIAYWLPEQQRFVDEDGRPVELPEPGSGRAWTPVEHDGELVAGIVHQDSLAAESDLVRTAGSNALLALENERLKADLRARLEELRASRVRIVEASDAARRQLERDIHDGAQQRLLALALQLRRARTKVSAGDEEAGSLLDESLEELGGALEELRELARGIHPAILSERGLEVALESLATRTPLPVDLDLDIPERPPAGVEATAYFFVSEALANVVRHADATRAWVRAVRRGSVLELEVRDDGKGGAASGAGSGLRGLEDRLSAAGGRLELRSPEGAGTRLRTELPCGS